MRIAIIGGTGVYDPKIFKEKESFSMRTPFGTTHKLCIGEVEGVEVVFLPRHGKGHALPPHRINYKANIYALKELEVERIFATNSVGGINPSLSPGDFLIPEDYIDFTRRDSTFYDNRVVHVDVSQAYCPELRNALIKATDEIVGKVFNGGVYACTQGPRFETKAEIRMLSMLGCDVVGMTGLPEAILARELEICYASICLVTNPAAGISKGKLTATEVIELVKKKEKELREILLKAIEFVPKKRNCPCKDALKGAEL
ncbi:MAG: S-methyl-5'-thioadenosine phosphorylase [Candidatus Hydrothermarchaeota archaeon]|nr:MAG: S-methyl-5'-thioadenosine phosphorylase [Candidatus Hydrothermarchaeota archaeon]